MTKLIFVNRFYAPDHSATAQILTDLCEYLAVNGHDVHVVTSAASFEDPEARLPPRELRNGVSVTRVGTTRFGRGTIVGRLVDYLSFFVTTTFALARMVSAGDVVVAKTDPPLISVPCAIVAQVKRARLVNWLQDLYPEVAVAMGVPGVSGPLGRLLGRLRDWTLRSAAMNIAIGERMAERLRALGVRREAVAVVPNWSDDMSVRPVPNAENDLRREWGFRDDQIVVAYSGNLGRAHDIDTALAAARELRARDDVRFLFIGGGHLTQAVRKAVADEELGNIVFQPYQPRERLALSLGAGDIHWLSLQPAFEGLIVPSKFFGIAAAGRPIIAVMDADGEVSRLIARHGCGRVVVPGDGAGFAQAVRELAESAALRSRLGIAAREMLDQGYRRAETLDTFGRLFMSIAGARRAPQLGADVPASSPGARIN